MIFPELDVRSIIREIRPDVQAKGTDYTADSVPERDVVAEYGGSVQIVGDPEGSFDQRDHPLPPVAEEILIAGAAGIDDPDAF